MIEKSHLSLSVILVVKFLFTLIWLIFLLVGATPIQQVKLMNRILQTPLDKASWGLYLGYIIFALSTFAISMFNLWLL